MTPLYTSRPNWLHIATGGLVFVVAPIAVLVAGALLALAVKSDLILGRDNKLAALTRINQSLERGRQATQRIDADEGQSLKADFLGAAQDSLLIAELQNRLRALCLANGVELNSANALPSKAVGANAYLGLRIMLRGRVSDVQKVLHAIETNAPLLFVERAAMRIDTWPLKSNDQSRNDAPALVVELDIFGARLPETRTEVSQKTNTVGTEQGQSPSDAAMQILAMDPSMAPGSVMAPSLSNTNRSGRPMR
jgi:hypothetical protein